jgi:hypothetical protein
LSVVVWVVVADTESIHLVTHVFGPEESSVGLKLRLDLEFTAISDWVSVESDSLGVKFPLLGLGVLAWVESQLVVVGISVSKWSQAEATNIHKRSSVSSLNVSNLLVCRLSSTLVWSHDNDAFSLHEVIQLVRKSVVFLHERSNGSGSSVEGEPLVVVSWLVVLESESVLVMTNVLFHDDRSLGTHLGSDLESLSVFIWLFSSDGTVLVDSISQVFVVRVAVVETHVDSPCLAVRVEASSGIVLEVLGRSIVPSDLVVIATRVLLDNSVSSVSQSMTCSGTDGVSWLAL